MSSDFERITPSQAGVDARGVLDFIAAQQESGQELHSLMLLRGGRVFADGWWAPYSPTTLQLVYSMSKTVTSALVGLAVADGCFGYDDLLVDLVPDLVDDAVGQAARRIRVRDLLGMASGHTVDPLLWRGGLTRASVRDLLAPGPDGTPGTTFCYNNLGTYALAKLVEQARGRTLLDDARDRIFEPLGVSEVSWARDAGGGHLGFSGLRATTEALARFVQCIADGGVRDGRRILAQEWIDNYSQVWTDNAIDGATADWSQGYGWQVWIGTHGHHRLDGAYGQFGVIVPDLDLVVVSTAEVADMQPTLDQLFEHLLPAVGRPGSSVADRELAEVLATAALTPVVGRDLRDTSWHGTDAAGGTLDLSEGVLTWTDAHSVTNRLVPAPGRWVPGLLQWPGQSLEIASSAALDDDGGVLVEVLALNSPHRFTWTLRPGVSEAPIGWRLEPLTGPDPRWLAIP